MYVDILESSFKCLELAVLAVNTSFVLLLEVKLLEFTTALLSCSKVSDFVLSVLVPCRLASSSLSLKKDCFFKPPLVIFSSEFESHRLSPPANPCIDNLSIYYGYSSSSLAQQSSTSSPSQL